ncbi:DUF2255 family protein [Tetragenococcus muriaticus]|uniref:DUF2255 family protein n=1 Tax=Tetragenococcus muriaticus TaxID=64642 RepID=UPI0004196392|nr:DUF2255 family protein [Tetragenococcus muriaticus]GMA47573.1 hypothetical protein GCM10025854_18230 [Tetragenococcus muriaticus]
MASWQDEELEAISKAPNLYISIPNSDGTWHRPAWIWIAQAGDDLFCRGYSGTKAKWYQSAKREGKGHISVGGVEKDVFFEFPTDKETNDAVDEGYKSKYGGSSYLKPMISQRAREATVRLIPVD